MQGLNRWRRFLHPGAGLETIWSATGLLSVAAFGLGVALCGSSPWYGLFYFSCFLLGLPFLTSIEWSRLRIEPTFFWFAAAVVALNGLLILHVILAGAELAALDNYLRLIAGVVNGVFLFAFFSYRRGAEFAFLLIVALAHALISIGAAFYESVDFSTLSFAGNRAGGTTNPIPFSEVLIVSAGLVAIAMAGMKWAGHVAVRLIAIGALVAVAFQAVTLTGTRGTLIVALPLLFLIASNMRFRIKPLHVAIAVGLILLAFAPFYSLINQRFGMLVQDVITVLFGNEADLSTSVRIRLQLWSEALELAQKRPFFGYGLGSFPEVFRDPSLGIPANSILLKYNHLHNQFIDLLLETGLAGVGIFSALLVLPLVAGARMLRSSALRTRGLALIWVSVSYTLFGLTQVFMAHSTSSLQFGVYLGVLMWTFVRPHDNAEPVRESQLAAAT